MSQSMEWPDISGELLVAAYAVGGGLQVGLYLRVNSLWRKIDNKQFCGGFKCKNSGSSLRC